VGVRWGSRLRKLDCPRGPKVFSWHLDSGLVCMCLAGHTNILGSENRCIGCALLEVNQFLESTGSSSEPKRR